MEKANQDIRKAIKASGFRNWQVAQKFGLSDSRFSVKLRYEVTVDEKQRVFASIDSLKQQAS